MTRFFARFVARFASDRSGATAIEYGLIMALIFMAILGAVIAIGGNLGNSMEATSEAITGAGS